LSVNFLQKTKFIMVHMPRKKHGGKNRNLKLPL